jgi:hypothetical protein
LTLLISAAAGLFFLGIGGLILLHSSALEATARHWHRQGCVFYPEDRPLTTTLTLAVLAHPEFPPPVHEGGDDAPAQIYGTHIHWASPTGPVFFLLLALVAFAGPPLLTERATVRIDEGADKLTVARSRLWHGEVLERPLSTLTGAVLVVKGGMRSLQLVFRSGETLDVAAPTHGDGGHAKLAKEIGAFIAARA